MTTKAKDLTERLRELRGQDEALWDLAVDTAGIGVDGSQDLRRVAAAETDADAASGAWDVAITAVKEDDLDAAVEALRGAERLSADWGDDSPATAAIAAVRDAQAAPILERATWHQRPRDAGQAVDVRWCAVEGGVIRRTVDGSTGETSYSLHEWSDDEDARHEPWNGILGCELDGDEITAAEAAELLAGEVR